MRATSVIVALALSAASVSSVHAQSSDACARMRGTSTSRNGARTTVVVSDDQRCLELVSDGRVEFTDDDSDVRSIEPGSTLRITERRGDVTRALAITSESGAERREYRVDGIRVPTEESRAWLRGVVLDAVRATGFGATERVARIRRTRGVAGVLDEVGQLRGDHVRRIYLEALIHGGPLSDDEMRRVVRIAGHDISSDYDRAETLLTAIDAGATRRGLASDVGTAATSISSDHDRGRVLTAIVARAEGDPPVVIAVNAARGMGSDYERGRLLTAVVQRSAVNDTPLRDAFFAAVDAMGSDYERRGVLLAALARDGVTPATVQAALRSTSRIGSDHDKASVLVAVGEHADWLRAPEVRTAFDSAVRTLGSDAEYRRVMRVVER